MILVDETVSKMLLDFSVSFEWSSTVGEFLGNNTDELRFVEITLLKPNGDKCWEYLATSSVGQMSLELRSESDCTISIGNSSGFTNGNWVLQVRARGYTLSAPIDTLSFEDRVRSLTLGYKEVHCFSQKYTQMASVHLAQSSNKARLAIGFTGVALMSGW